MLDERRTRRPVSELPQPPLGSGRSDSMRRTSGQAPPHPGEILRREFLEPLELTQLEVAKRLRIPLQRLNQILSGKRSITPDTALRLARLFDCAPEFWLSQQAAWDLYVAQAHLEDNVAKITPYDQNLAFGGSDGWLEIDWNA